MRPENKLLFTEIQRGNKEVFEAVFREYYPMLVRFAEGMVFDHQVCEDVVQSLFLHLWEDAKQINIVTSLRAYLLQSVRNRCLNHLRDLKIHDRHNLLYIESYIDTNIWEEPAWEDSALNKKIFDAINALPPQMANILEMKYFGAKKYHEIAQINNISENTVKTQLKRARARLRAVLRYNTLLYFLLF